MTLALPLPPPADHMLPVRYADRMTIQIAIRLPPDLVEGVDRLVERGRYANRTDAVRVALERLVAGAREAELDEAIVAGYRAAPDDHEHDAWAEAELRALVEEEPW